MIRGMKLAAVGMLVATGTVHANHGHHGHGHGHHGHHHHHGHGGPRFGLTIAPVFAPPPPPVYAYPAPAYGYPAYVAAPVVYAPPPVPVYAPAPLGVGLQTRNFSLFLGH